MDDTDLATADSIFRPKVKRILRADWITATVVFLIYLGLTLVFRTLALVFIWLSIFWLLPRSGRRAVGLRYPKHGIWWLVGPLSGLLLVSGTALILWSLYGWREPNMFYDMTQAVGEGYRLLPEGLPGWMPLALVGFGWIVESPLLEEPLFRGLMLRTFGDKWGYMVGMILQALAFTVVHPLNSVSWVLSIFAAGMAYGLIAKYSQSLWPAVLAHGAYNVGILWITFHYLPEFVF